MVSSSFKAIIILNVAGYYDNLLAMIKRAVEDGFIGDYDAFYRLAVFVDEGAARRASEAPDKDVDWGKGQLVTAFSHAECSQYFSGTRGSDEGEAPHCRRRLHSSQADI